VKKAIALRLIKSPAIRKAAVKALKNPKVRGVVRHTGQTPGVRQVGSLGFRV